MKEYFNKVIFFDLYQTLLDVDLGINNPSREVEGWNTFAESLLKYKKEISSLELQKLYLKKRADFYSKKDIEIYHHNLFNIISDILCNDLGLRLSKEEIVGLINEYRKANRGRLLLYPGVFDTLSRLSKDYTLSTASYAQGCFTQLELRELDIEKFFSHFIYSSDLGYKKKSPEFYKRALEIVGKVAADCIMVGDNYDVDVLAPQQLGIRAIWIKNPITAGKYPMEKDPPNKLDLANFEKLPELINRINNHAK